MALKKVTPEQKLLSKFKRLRRELDLAIAEYESETAPPDPEPKRVKFVDPETGKSL